MIVRSLPLSVVFVLNALVHHGAAADLRVFNLSEDPVVICLYEPGDEASTRLMISLEPDSAKTDIPLPETKNGRFAVAFEAEFVDGKIVRTKPFQITGLGRVFTYSTNAENDANDALVFYNNPTIPQGPACLGIWSARTETEALGSIKDALINAKARGRKLKMTRSESLVK